MWRNGTGFVPVSGFLPFHSGFFFLTKPTLFFLVFRGSDSQGSWLQRFHWI